jgi:tetratricopeptide (TPR) repeat protein
MAEQARPTSARRLWEKALQLRPREPVALARLAWVTHQLGFTTRGAQLLDEAISLRPTEPDTRREIGDVLVATGRLPEALRWFEDLAATSPNSRALQVRLAEVTVWAGQYERGLERVARLLDADETQRNLWPTFVDAASSAKTMTDKQVELARRLAAAPVPIEGAEAQMLYLSRLSWVLLREAKRLKPEEAPPLINALLDQALRLRAPQTQARRELAGVLTAARRFTDALTLYEGLARENPGDIQVRIRVAEVALWGGDHAGSLARFEALLRDGVRDPRVLAGYVAAAAAVPAITLAQAELAWQLSDRMPALEDKAAETAYRSHLAWILLREGRGAKPEWLARAGVLLDQAVALKPTEPAIKRELAGVLSAAGRFAAGLELFEGMPLQWEDRLQRIGLLAGARRFDEAVKEAEAVLASRHNEPQARLWLARIALARGDHADALERARQLLEEDFERPELWRLFADAAGSADQLTAAQVRLALRIAEQLPCKQPAWIAALTRLAWALHQQAGRTGDDTLRATSAALAERALALDPRDPGERRELAGVLAAVGHPQSARQLLRGLTERTAADCTLLVNLLAAEKDFDQAEAEARALVATQPDSFDAQLLLANVLSWNHKPEEALRVCERLQRSRPRDTRLTRRLAELSLSARRYDDALRYHHQLLADDWQQPDLWSGYVDAAASVKTLDLRPHKPFLLRITEQAGTSRDAVFLTRFGWVLRRLEETKKSLPLLRRALALDPDSREIRRNLADALQAAGLYDEAERHYQHLLSTGARTP